MNKEELMLRKRLIELSNQAYSRDIVTFSDFLNLNELHILHTTPKDMLLTRYETYGGYDMSERQMTAFLPDALYYEYEYPLKAVEITPLHQKFEEDLSHRDYLGALMNLGIDRARLGDIVVDERTAVVFAKEEITEYIAEHLFRIRHTEVRTVVKDTSDTIIIQNMWRLRELFRLFVWTLYFPPLIPFQEAKSLHTLKMEKYL